MSGEFGAFRFGWDSPARISTTTVMLQGSDALLPAEPRYAVMGFALPSTTGSSVPSGTTEDGHPIWTSIPSRVDLAFYQGDDVVIPLYFNNPELLNDNMAASFEWIAQVRRVHTYRSRLVSHFSVKATYHPSEAVPASEDDEHTLVEMFLPRALNIEAGLFRWEIASYSPVDYTRFPEPPDWDQDEPWPPDTTTLRTWLYGRVAIVPRLTTTDMLPTSATPGVLTLGPNGMVIMAHGAIGGAGYNPSVGYDGEGVKTYAPEVLP